MTTTAAIVALRPWWRTLSLALAAGASALAADPTAPLHTVQVQAVKATASEDGSPGEFVLRRSGSSDSLRVLLQMAIGSRKATLGTDVILTAPDAEVAVLSTDQVASITLTGVGSGYATAPTVTVSAPPSGTTATAVASISAAGIVTGIVITNPGSGYVAAPTITVAAGTTTATATAALATAGTLSVTIPDGVPDQRILVDPQDDFVKELAEDVTLSIRNSPLYIRGPQVLATVTLADDDMIASLWSPDAVASEFFADPSPSGLFRLSFNDWGLRKNFADELSGSAELGADYQAFLMPVHYPAGGDVTQVTTANTVAYTFTNADGTAFSGTLRGSGWYLNTPPAVSFTAPTEQVATVDTVTVTAGGSGYDPEDPPVVIWPDSLLYGKPAYGYGVVDDVGTLLGVSLVDSGVYVVGELIGVPSQISGTAPSSPATIVYSTVTRSGSTTIGEAVINGIVTGVALPATRTWSTDTTITISGGGGEDASAEVLVVAGAVTGIKITNPGTGFRSRPTVTLLDGTFTGSTLANISGPILIDITNAGLGYTAAPTLSLAGGNPTAAATIGTETLALPGGFVPTASVGNFTVTADALDRDPSISTRASDWDGTTIDRRDWKTKITEEDRAVNVEGTNLLEVSAGYGTMTVGDIVTIGTNTSTWYVVLAVELPKDSPAEVDATHVLHLSGTLPGSVGDGTVVVNRIPRGAVRQDVRFTPPSTAGYPAFDYEVLPIADTDLEGAEGVTVTGYASSDFALLEPTTSSLTLADDDAIATITLTNNASEPNLSGSARVSLSAALPIDVTIPFAISGSATPGNGVDATPADDDYIITGLDDMVAPTVGQANAYATGSITIPAGSRFADIIVGTQSDTLSEGTERVTITLQQSHDLLLAGSGSSQSNPSATINISDSQGTVKVDSTYTRDGQEDGNTPTPANVRLSITPPTGVVVTSPVGIRFRIDGSATYNADYLVSGTGVTFDVSTMEGSVVLDADATASRDVQIQVKDDLLGERDETVSLTILSGSGYTIDPNASGASVQLVDDEPVISIEPVTDPAEPNVDGRFHLSYTSAGQDVALNRSVTVPFTIRTADYTDSFLVYHYMATEDVDYNALAPKSVTFVAGSNDAYLDIVPKPDNRTEPIEEIDLSLSSDVGYTLLSANAILYMSDAPLMTLTAGQPAIEGGQTGNYTVGYAGPARSGAIIVDLAVDASSTVTVPQSISGLGGNASINSLAAEKVIGAAVALTTGGTVTVSTVVPTINLTGVPVVLRLRQDSLTGTVLGTTTVTAADYTSADLASRTQFRISAAGIAAGTTLVVTADASTAPLLIASIPTQLPLTATLIGSETDVTYPSSVEIPAGQTSVDVTITAVDDAILDLGESLALALVPSNRYRLADNAGAVALEVRDNEPSLSMTATTASAKEGTTQGVIAFTLTGSHGGLTIPLKFTGTASSANDYAVTFDQGAGAVAVAVSSNSTADLVIASGVSSGTLRIIPGADGSGESPETAIVTVRLGNGSASTVTGHAATVTITDDKPVISILRSIQAAESGTAGRFTVSMDAALGSDLTVSYGIGGTAEAGADYVLLSGTVVIPAGQTSAGITVTPVDDALIEGFESVVLTIASNTSYVIDAAAPAASLLITDDEFQGGLPIVTVTADTLSTVEGGAVLGQFTVTRSYAVGQLQVAYALEGTSTATTDYAVSGTSGVITFAAGESERTVAITPVDDGLAEGAETVVLRLLSAPTYDIDRQSAASLTIADNDVAVSVEVRDPLAHEKAQDSASFRVVASPASIDRRITVRLDGTALWGSGDDKTVSAVTSADYFLSLAFEGGTTFTPVLFTPSPWPVGSRLTFVLPAGVTYADIRVNIAVDTSGGDDIRPEGRETVIPVVETSSDYVLGSPFAGEISIGDNDVQVSISRARDGGEPTTAGAFGVAFSSPFPAGVDIDVPFDVAGTATAGIDYATLADALRIAAGTTTGEILVRPLAESPAQVEGSETVELTLRESLDYVISGQSDATVNLADEIATVTVAAGAAPAEGSPVTPGTFTVTAVRSVTDGFAIYYALTGTAAQGTDYAEIYTGASGSITMAAGVSTATLTITPVDDVAAESSEDIILTLLDGPGYVLGATTSATVSITDDEPVVGINGTTDGAEGGASLAYVVGYAGTALNRSITVAYSLGGASTATTADIGALAGSLTIPANQNSTTLTIPVVDDALAEGNETVVIQLSSSSAYQTSGSADSASRTITDNEGTVSIAATTAAASESGTDGLFTVTLTPASTSAVTVTYTVGGTATSGTDYVNIGTSVTIPAGSTTSTIPVDVRDDVVTESTETVVVTVVASTAYGLGTTSATVSIADNESGSSGGSGGTTTGGSIADPASGGGGGCGTGGGLAALIAGVALVVSRRRRR